MGTPKEPTARIWNKYGGSALYPDPTGMATGANNPEPVTDLREKLETKDTVMSEEETEAMCRFGDFRLALQAQAEITWPIAEKAGIQKVVEWLEQHGDLHFNFPFANIRREPWQAFLKECGIDASKGDYRKARGCAPRPPGAPLPEDIIRKSRGG